MEEMTQKLVELAQTIVNESTKNTKASHARIRKATIEIAKVGREYRKASIEADKK